ncbi:MAG: hypothetical protein HKN72_03140 [Gemmatimonadetes bacterium]|nr:hypothetical protein [Gemmatimonadota bacterium]
MFRAAGLYLVAAWGVVEVSATVFPLLGVGDWAPRLALALVAAGFPVALWWAWLFDLQPTGIEAANGEVSHKGLRWGQASLVGAATIVGLTIPAFLFLGRDAASEASIATSALSPVAAGGDMRTVALVPFTQGGRDEQESYFSEGVADEIVSMLARVDGIRVLGRAAAARLVANGSNPYDIGTELGAGFILEGTVWRASGRVRLRTSLTDVRTLQVVWSDDLERDLTVENLFDVQRQVATAVAHQLRDELVEDGAPFRFGPLPTRDFGAFERYLEGNAAMARRTPASVAQAISNYRNAAALDSAFVSAIAREAYASALFIDWGWTYPGATVEELLARAQDLASRALAMDSTNADAWLASAYTRFMANRRRPELSLPYFKRALELNGGADAEALYQYGQTLMVSGRYNDAISAYHGVLAQDPTRAMALVPMATISYRRGDLEQAWRWADSAIVVGSEVPYVWAIHANLRNSSGDPLGALEDARRALSIDPSYGIPARSALAVAYYQLGDQARANAELERALIELPDAQAPGQTDALFIGGALVRMGRVQEALDFVERAGPRSALLWFYLQYPDFDAIRNEPRFAAVVAEAKPNESD